MANHHALTGASLHVPGYCQPADPGAVGAGKYWIDTGGGSGLWTLKVRNTGNDGWETIASGGVAPATAAEIDAGATTEVMPVDQFVASKRNVRHIEIRLLGKETDVTAGTSIGGDFRLPTIAGTIVDCGCYVDTAGASGDMVVDIHLNGATIMAVNKITLAAGQKSSEDGGAPQPALTTTSYTANGIITVDVDQQHATPAKGLVVWFDIREA